MSDENTGTEIVLIPDDLRRAVEELDRVFTILSADEAVVDAHELLFGRFDQALAVVKNYLLDEEEDDEAPPEAPAARPSRADPDDESF